MKAWILICRALPANGMALFPFIILKKRSMKADPILINHERIHLRQQLELLILPFYVFYLLNYLLNRLHYKNHDQAYYYICFEKEAYANERNLGYLSSRKPFSWLKFLRKEN